MEFEFIRWLQDRLPPSDRAPLGLRDDAALLRVAGTDLLVTVDTLTDGVDFKLAEIDPRRAGRKALAVNLSDIAAMAGTPLAAVVSLVLPRHTGQEQGALALAQAFCAGLIPLAAQHGVEIIGGDTNTWDGALVASVTVIGLAGPKGPLRRAGAKPGDWIIVTGAYGGSLLGHHLDFEPRLAEARRLMEGYELHAGIDVSDGLSLDLSRLAWASGCGAELNLPDVPIAPAAHERAQQIGGDFTALECALADGEDFELILAVPPAEAQRMLAEQTSAVPLTCVGKFVPLPGLRVRDAAGQIKPMIPRGYEHQAD